VARSIACMAFGLVWCAAAVAEAPLEFGAGPAAAVWQFEGSRTSCRLSHEIPNFGEARFVQAAGGKLEFDMSAWRIEFDSGMDVTSDSPPWLPVHPTAKELGRVEATASHEIVASAELADSMLRALYRGEQPRFVSPDVSVSISAVSFRPLYDSYARCVAQLLPASFSQLERSAIVFAPNRAVLNDAAKARLDLIAEYLHADRSVTHIFVDGHTDNSGRERKNRALSEKRAKVVADYLVASGCGLESIETRSHGSRFPIASNKTEEGRAQNRRTTVRLERIQTKVAKL
jgi:outer membrane protein OmpA-like peptidoglycan-associated protein